MPSTFSPQGRRPAQSPSEHRQATTINKSRGRVETRFLTLTNILAKRGNRLGLNQGLRLVRRSTEGDQKTIETNYRVTSLTPEYVSPTKLLQLARDQWAIEDKLHYARKVRLGGDHCQIRTSNEGI